MKYLIFDRKYFFKSLLIGFCLFLFNIVSSYLIHELIGESLGKQNTNAITNDFNSFIFIVLIVPVFETLIFQWLIIYQTYESYRRENKRQLAILISSILFGLSHSYSVYYILVTTTAGVLLATSFCYFREKTNWLSGIIYVIIIHSLSNLLVFITKILNI
jgi:membrane protease YdiL (CAAX protease family)